MVYNILSGQFCFISNLGIFSLILLTELFECILISFDNLSVFARNIGITDSSL